MFQQLSCELVSDKTMHAVEKGLVHGTGMALGVASDFNAILFNQSPRGQGVVEGKVQIRISN
jgi:hypothetical protein